MPEGLIMFKGFQELFDDIVKNLQLTEREKADYKSSLKNSIKRWRIKGLLRPDELPDKNHELVWSWRVQQDKQMINQMSESLANRTENYKRKIFGLKNVSANSRMFRHLIQEMLKEGFRIDYPDDKLIEEFFTNKKPK